MALRDLVYRHTRPDHSVVVRCKQVLDGEKGWTESNPTISPTNQFPSFHAFLFSTLGCQSFCIMHMIFPLSLFSDGNGLALYPLRDPSSVRSARGNSAVTTLLASPLV